MDEKYISVTKFKETLAKLIVEGGAEATRTTIARTLGEVVPKLLDDEPFADVQPVKHGRWITKSKDYYKAWQDSGRSWDDMSYFVTGLKFACSNCFEQFDVNAEGVEKWNGCPLCLARMDLDSVTHDRCSNYMDCDGSCFIDDTPCDCDGNIEKCKGR